MELRQLLRVLRRRWRFTVVTFLLGIVGAGLLTSMITPSYKSEIRVYVTATSTGTVDAYNLGVYATQRIASYADFAKDPTLLARVIKSVGVDMAPEDLASRVTATAVPTTAILQVSIEDSDPQVARELARAEGKEIVKLVGELEAPGTTNEGVDVPAPIIARVAGDASFDANPVFPSLPLNLVVGAILGLLVGVAGALVRDIVDNSIKTLEDLAEVTDAAVMAVVPYDSSVPKHPLVSDAEGSIERVEAFRVLRTNLQFVDLDAKRQMLVISSAVPEEGKTVTSTNLAITLAQTGRRVLIMDCDFRKPRVARILGLENSVGLLTVLVGRAQVEECIQQHASGVDFLATGPLPPNPTEVLETQAMRDLLTMVREDYDVVIIDAPPMLPVADPAIIAPMTDGVLLVTRHGSTSKDLVQETVGRLDAVGARIVGVVLNMAPRRALSGYGYGYGYGYGETTTVSRPARAVNLSRRAVRDSKHSQPSGRAR